MAPALAEGASILDVGSGRQPILAVTQRPPDSTYVGLDVSEQELALAGDDAYDRVIIRSVTERAPELVGSFDLAISMQVLEHVKPLDVALDNIRTYLRPGGRFVALLSGSFSAFGVVNRILPNRVGVPIVSRVMHKPADTVFPAYYDRCYYSALERLGEPWSHWEVAPLYAGARYFSFLKPLHAAYIAYEDWARRHEHRNLATHYILDGRR